jgi:hypothetical protein
MRSIGRVEIPRWLFDESPKTEARMSSESIEICWGNPMLVTANGRGLGKRGCIMISVRLPVDAAGGCPLTEPSVPTRDPTVLGVNLNCSESRRRLGPQALLMADSGSPPGGIMCLNSRP